MCNCSVSFAICSLHLTKQAVLDCLLGVSLFDMEYRGGGGNPQIAWRRVRRTITQMSVTSEPNWGVTSPGAISGGPHPLYTH